MGIMVDDYTLPLRSAVDLEAIHHNSLATTN
jgi:hypothetical protein